MLWLAPEQIRVHDANALCSDMGPGDWALLAKDIETNYYYFDGFVVLMGKNTGLEGNRMSNSGYEC